MVKDALGTDISAPFPRLTFRSDINETGIDIDELKTKRRDRRREKAKVKVDFKKCVGFGEYLDELYRKPLVRSWKVRVGLRLSIEMKPLTARVPGEPTKRLGAAHHAGSGGH